MDEELIDFLQSEAEIYNDPEDIEQKASMLQRNESFPDSVQFQAQPLDNGQLDPFNGILDVSEQKGDFDVRNEGFGNVLKEMFRKIFDTYNSVISDLMYIFSDFFEQDSTNLETHEFRIQRWKPNFSEGNLESFEEYRKRIYEEALGTREKYFQFMITLSSTIQNVQKELHKSQEKVITLQTNLEEKNSRLNACRTEKEETIQSKNRSSMAASPQEIENTETAKLRTEIANVKQQLEKEKSTVGKLEAELRTLQNHQTSLTWTQSFDLFCTQNTDTHPGLTLLNQLVSLSQREPESFSSTSSSAAASS